MSYRSTEIYSHIKEKFSLDAEHVLPQIVKQKRHFMNTTYNDNKTVVDRQAEKNFTTCIGSIKMNKSLRTV